MLRLPPHLCLLPLASLPATSFNCTMFIACPSPLFSAFHKPSLPQIFAPPSRLGVALLPLCSALSIVYIPFLYASPLHKSTSNVTRVRGPEDRSCTSDQSNQSSIFSIEWMMQSIFHLIQKEIRVSIHPEQ